MSTIPITEVGPRISQQLTLLVNELPDAHDDTARLVLMTTRTASQSTGAPEPVGNHAFIYEASDIRPGITIGEFRSQRSGNRDRRGLYAWLRRLLSRGQGWASARCDAPRLTRCVAGATDDGDLR